MIYGTREKLATFFNCPRPDHVVFTANSTEALNMAICGLLDPGDHVIATDLEHNSVLRPLYRLEAERSVSLSFVPADRQGRIDYGEFGRLIRPETPGHHLHPCLQPHRKRREYWPGGGHRPCPRPDLSCGRLPNSGSPAYRHGGPADRSALFHRAQVPDGAAGNGGLCLGENVALRPWKVGGTGVQTYNPAQPEQLPTRLEAGTLNGHGIAGLSAALDYIRMVGMETIREKEEALMRRFYEGVSTIPGVTVYGDFAAPRTAVVALNIRDYDSGEVSDALAQDYGIATRPGAHCAPRMHRALGTERQGAVRFSFGWFNTEHEIDTAIRAVKELAE